MPATIEPSADEQSPPNRAALQRYADDLPAIYRELLAVFPQIDPHRHAGDGLAPQSLHARLGERYSYRQVLDASDRLADAGVFLRSGILLRPTDIGERLITAVTGRTPEPDDVPDLPPLPTADR